MFKKVLGSFFVFALCFSVASTSFANTSSLSDDAEDIKMDEIPISLEVQSQLLTKSSKAGNQSVTITDESELERIANERGLEEIPTKIEYEYNPEETDSTPIEDIVSPYAVGQICYVNDMGPGFYNKGSDLYKRFTIDGPDTFVIEETVKKYSSFSGTLGASKSAVEASIGFKIGAESSITFRSTTPIASNQRGTFNLYTTYQKVMYAVDNGSQCRIGYAYRPNGTFIEKIFTKK